MPFGSRVCRSPFERRHLAFAFDLKEGLRDELPVLSAELRPLRCSTQDLTTPPAQSCARDDTVRAQSLGDGQQFFKEKR